MLHGVLRPALLAGSIAAVTLAGACATRAASDAGTTVVTVRVANRDGSAPGREAMNTVRDSLTRRLTGAGLAHVTASGAPQWTDLTAEAFTNRGGACRATSPNANGGSDVCQVAIVTDNEVVSAPAIQAVLASTCEITGSYTKQAAEALAAQIRGGAIPFRLTVVSISGQSPSPTTHR